MYLYDMLWKATNKAYQKEILLGCVLSFICYDMKRNLTLLIDMLTETETALTKTYVTHACETGVCRCVIT